MRLEGVWVRGNKTPVGGDVSPLAPRFSQLQNKLPSGLPLGLKTDVFEPSRLPQAIRFGANGEFNLERFMDLDADDWLCSAIKTATENAEGETVTPQDLFLAILDDFQVDVAQHEVSRQPLKRHANSLLGIKLGLSKSPNFAQEHQPLLQWVTQMMTRLKITQAQGKVAPENRQKILSPTLQEALHDLSLIFQEIRQQAPVPVQRKAPLADWDMFFQVLVRVAPEPVKSDVLQLVKLSGLTFEPAIDQYLPDSLKQKYAQSVQSLPSDIAMGSTAPLELAQRTAMIQQSLPQAQAAELQPLVALSRGLTPKGMQWVLQQAKSLAEVRHKTPLNIKAEDILGALQKMTPAIAQEMATAILSPQQAEWNAFQSVTQAVVQLLLEKESQDNNAAFGAASGGSSNVSCLVPPPPLTEPGAREASKSALFQRIVMSEAAKVIQQMVYQDARVPQPQDARLASRTALLMSAQYMMLKNKIFVEGDPARWMMAGLPQQVHRDVEAVMNAAQQVATTLIEDYQEFIVDQVSQLIGVDGQPGQESIPIDAFKTAMDAFNQAQFGVEQQCFRKINEVKTELFQLAAVETNGRTIRRPLAGTEGN